MFKDVYKGVLGEKAAQYQTVGFLVSSACAEVIADVLLCPWEAVSIHPLLFMIECAKLFAWFDDLVEGAYANL